MSSSKFRKADRLTDNCQNMVLCLAELAKSTGAVNLGLGCPDYPPPKYVRDTLAKVAQSDDYRLNQYTRGCGHPRLVNAIAKMYSGFHQRELDPMKEVMVSTGASESLFCTFQGLVNPGDEVIIIEPFFDQYITMVEVAGGIPVYIPLRPTTSGECSSNDWKLDPVELASKFSCKTKLLVLNTPNNPLGKVFSREELAMIADLCTQHDVVCVADEVYEFMTYPGVEHARIAVLPNMWERTITFSSAGKTFGATGWRLGWSIGPEHLLKLLMSAHQSNITMCCTPVQEAVAQLLELEQSRFDNKDACYIHTLPSLELLPKRDRMAGMLRDAGMLPIIPDGGYFMLVDWTRLPGITDEMIDDGTDDSKGLKFTKWMMKEKKLGFVPCTTFYGPENKHLAENLIRICYIKKDETIDAAGEILKYFKEPVRAVQ